MLYDVIVIGAGHAGCEAALAAARMGCKTLVITIKLENIALMPCNPSIGGPAKGHLAREIDALGGVIGDNIDKTFIQIRMLNTSKGPAVQALRAQADKGLYASEMRNTLEKQQNLTIAEDMVEELIPIVPAADSLESEIIKPSFVIKTRSGINYCGRTVVLTTGTSLSGKIIMGEKVYEGGRAGEPAATKISTSLRSLGFSMGRHKTGTPPRLDARTIDFNATTLQPGSPEPLYFSFWRDPNSILEFPTPNPVYPPGPITSWRFQMPCYLISTNLQTHQIIQNNVHRAPMFNGTIQGTGPRYCPSIEDKVVRFAHKDSHGLFLEPEGWETNEVYLQGANTSLPEDVQDSFVHSIPALENAVILKPGYAIEYDFVLTDQIQATMESKLVGGLYFAGQVCGTSGYEEAAGQGIMAGINAALQVQGKDPLTLRRDEAYLGVMIDDLVTRDHFEPYRMLTSRAEYRLLLRQDNADTRLAHIGHKLGLINNDQYRKVERKREQVDSEIRRLGLTYLPQNGSLSKSLKALNIAPVNKSTTALEFLRRPEVDYDTSLALGLGNASLDDTSRRQVEIEVKYEQYIARQLKEVKRIHKLELYPLPEDMDYEDVRGLSNEAKENLKRFRPLTLGQASRIPGVGSSDLSLLMVFLKRHRVKTASFQHLP